MENLSLTWSFVLESKKLIIAALTKSGTPVILLKSIADGKNIFFIPLCDWSFIVQKLQSAGDYFTQDSIKRKKLNQISENLHTGSFVQLRIDQIAKSHQLIFSYNQSWLDKLLDREAQNFSLTLNESKALLDILPQILNALEMMTGKQSISSDELDNIAYYLFNPPTTTASLV